MEGDDDATGVLLEDMEADVLRLGKRVVRLLAGGWGGCVKEDALVRAVVVAAVREEVEDVDGTLTIVAASEIGLSA